KNDRVLTRKTKESATETGSRLFFAVKRYAFQLKKCRSAFIKVTFLKTRFAFELLIPLFRTVIRKVTVMNNVRFATALHILTLLHLQPGELLPSEYIAGSINLNPAVVRKELSNLRNFGLVESKEGKGGGSTLAKPASE